MKGDIITIEELQKIFPHSKECIKGRRDLENNLKMTIDCMEPERQEKIKAIFALFQKVVDKACPSLENRTCGEHYDGKYYFDCDECFMLNIPNSKIESIRASFKDIVEGKIEL